MSEALLNLGILFIVMTPLVLLSGWVIRKTPLQGLSGVAKWRAYRIHIGAWGIILLSVILLIYFILDLIA
jgi:hypothetical protein